MTQADTIATTEPTLVEIQAKIFAEVVLGKIRLKSDAGEPRYMHALRGLVSQIRRASSPENYERLAEGMRSAAHALVAVLFDAVTDSTHSETRERLLTLSIPDRVWVEQIAAHMTGRDNDKNHWNDDLYRMKQSVDKVEMYSISGVIKADVRNGYDEFVHAVVDVLWDNRKTLIA